MKATKATQATQATKQATPVEETPQASKQVSPSETPAVTPEVLPVIEGTVLMIPGNKIPLEMINSRIQKASANAGRIRAKAQSMGLGRIAKDLSGHGTLIPTLAVLNDLESLGEFGSDKAKAKAIKDEVRYLNMLVDALTGLGLASRKNG